MILLQLLPLHYLYIIDGTLPPPLTFIKGAGLGPSKIESPGHQGGGGGQHFLLERGVKPEKEGGVGGG